MMDRNALVTGRVGGILNVPCGLGGRCKQSAGQGGTASGEDSNEDHALGVPEENGPRFMEGYHGGSGPWGFPSQQPPVMGGNFAIGPPPYPGVRFNHVGQGGMLTMGGLQMGPLSPHHLYMPPTAGSGPKL